ncbi:MULTISPECIES: ligase-associated DNA damage response endonuclease PdeM [unclassified Methylobacterium]|uniref:ligase-associated DNA damage response endonuclease PdeM n=1 Tax=unclassified Methylobacterium TaxID=2615210 RepID=UPI0011C1E9D7|nr:MULTISPECIES: ligase-associated DNA damage response endonuclease PdeM [unclassified Methylobacterium]QEE39714.1 ligase-associated DNA damage response endonuclease PdeM [Methylobacterium sp. WL1]TXN58782.1 ligase-associated DNA damage response endonuclease PdeM [Methylobacterium sp. WL2]
MAAGLRLEKTHKHPTLLLAGETLVLDLCGGVWLPEHRTLIVSDLHLEKGSSYAARTGQFLPPYDTRETLACLHEAVVRHDPARVVALGDSFHDVRGPERMEPGDRAMVSALQEGRDWVWIAGNHDAAVSEGVGGRYADALTLGGLILRHEPSGKPVPGEIAGHLHPCGKVAMRGRAVRRRCFVTDGTRLVMPAFGAYAGGLNVRDRAIDGLFPNGFTAHLLGDGRVFTIGRAQLARD